MIDKIEILQHGESRDFGSHSCEEAPGLLRIVAYRHELVTQLGKCGFGETSYQDAAQRVQTLLRSRNNRFFDL